MAKRKRTTHGDAASVAKEPRSLPLARKGVRTGVEFCQLMSALMSDVLEGSLSPGVANAAVSAGGKLLKAAEMQIKYGAPNRDGSRVLNLIGGPCAIDGRVDS